MGREGEVEGKEKGQRGSQTGRPRERERERQTDRDREPSMLASRQVEIKVSPHQFLTIVTSTPPLPPFLPSNPQPGQTVEVASRHRTSTTAVFVLPPAITAGDRRCRTITQDGATQSTLRPRLVTRLLQHRTDHQYYRATYVLNNRIFYALYVIQGQSLRRLRCYLWIVELLHVLLNFCRCGNALKKI